jgi:hypothetical protein
MRWSPVRGEWFCLEWTWHPPGEPEPVFAPHNAPISEAYAAVHRLGPFARQRPPESPSIPSIPGFRWTGQFYERMGPGPSHADNGGQSRRAESVPWLCIVVWFGVALLLLRLL